MEKFNIQVSRFIQVLQAKEKFSINCDKCPLQKECETALQGLAEEEIYNNSTCEEVLLKWVITGEIPT